MSKRYKFTLCPCGRPAVDNLFKAGRCAECKAREDRYNRKRMICHQPPPSRAVVSEYRLHLPWPLRQEFGL